MLCLDLTSLNFTLLAQAFAYFMRALPTSTYPLLYWNLQANKQTKKYVLNWVFLKKLQLVNECLFTSTGKVGPLCVPSWWSWTALFVFLPSPSSTPPFVSISLSAGQSTELQVYLQHLTQLSDRSHSVNLGAHFHRWEYDCHCCKESDWESLQDDTDTSLQPSLYCQPAFNLSHTLYP